MRVVHFQRRQRSQGNFSLEFIFSDVRENLKDKIDFTIVTAPYFSNGVFKRLLSAIYAACRQGEVNHVTGDTHFLNLFFDSQRSILTVLDCGFLNVNNRFLQLFYKFFWLTLPIKRARFITAISSSTKLDIIRHSGCSPDKIYVIPVAVHPLYQPMPREFNLKYPTLLQVGTSPNKNISRLIEAIKGIACKIVIIGKIDSELKIKLDNSNIDYLNRINISVEELYQEYVACDIVTFVSTFEGFGMPIIEANCVERVVITGNTSSMPEVAGKAAHIVNPFSVEDIRNGIQRLIDDHDYRSELIEYGKSNRIRFNNIHIANMYYDLYMKISSNT